MGLVKFNKFRFLMIIFIFIFAWIMQDRLFLNWDVGTLLSASNKLLSGGSYVKDFFTPNPPMILYLYSLPLILSKLFSLKIVITFRGYIFILASFSIALCAILTRNIFSNQDRMLESTFLIALTAVFLVLPMHEFGQREHLLVIMSLPYLLLMTCRLLTKSIHISLSIIIGVFAGLAFAIKPQFVTTFLIMEAYYLYKEKNYWAWLRPESLGILIIFLSYLMVVLLTRQDYVFGILPYLMEHYYSSSSASLNNLIFNAPIFFSILAIPFFLTSYKENTHKTLCTVLCIGLIGFLSTYFLQRITYVYHVIPSLSLSILLFIQTYGYLAKKSIYSKYDSFILLAFSICFFVFIFFLVHLIWISLILSPIVFFGFYSVLFLYLFYIFNENNFLKALLSIALIIPASCLFTSEITRSPWYSYDFPATFTFLFILASIFIANIKKNIIPRINIALIGILIFSVPVWVGYNIYLTGLSYKNNILLKLITFINSQPKSTRSIYVFSATTSYAYPLGFYADASVSQRFDSLWMIKGFEKQINLGSDRYVKEAMKNSKDKHFFLNMIVDDITHKKPDFIFIEEKNPLISKYISFNYLKYFSENESFRRAWGSYHYFTDIELPFNAKLRIYKRNEK